MIRSTGEKITNSMAFAIVLLFNYLANAVPLGGQTTGEISDGYFSMFTPAGFTFAIWGVIYFALFCFIVRQFKSSESVEPALARIKNLFIANCFANAGWIVTWHYNQLVVSLLLMLIILITLFKINEVISSDTSLTALSDQLLIAVPFQIYFGWISVASIANIGVLQSAYELNDALISQQSWTLVKLFVAAAIGFFWGWKPGRAAFLFVISWAGFGIAMANSTVPMVKSASSALAIIALIAATLVVFGYSPHSNRILRTRTGFD